MKSVEGRLSLSPSDLTSYLACTHLTALSLAVERGEIERPRVDDPQGELVKRKGREHEDAYLERLRREGRSVRTIEFHHDFERAAAETERALRDGVDVVYQGVLAHGRWRGFADFLIRDPQRGYEAYDTKLARHAKPAYILQLLFYNEQLARILGREPELSHVVLGSGETVRFRPEQFSAYYRHVRTRLEHFVADPPATEPWPCAHCEVCDFRMRCEAEWERVDHLTGVARIRTDQIQKLIDAGITTLAALAQATERPASLAVETFETLHHQARLQLHSRTDGVDTFELLQPEPGRGLAMLPDPSPGDLFFDFEGDPFWDAEGSLEYLWGILDVSGTFEPLWAQSRDEERRAFEHFIDLVHARLRADPHMHVYHYAPYEISALKRLMGRYGTREAELDELLRGGVFVDLYAVVRHGLRVSRPGYGLKQMEAFLDFTRTAEVSGGGESFVAVEQWRQTGEPALLAGIEAYNHEDCIATRLLRDWLLERRAEVLERFGPFPQVKADEQSKAVPEAAIERARLRESLLDAGEDLAGELLEYHRREQKPVWWAFFLRLGVSPEDLIEDAEAIGCLTPLGEPEPVKRSHAHRFGFPAQETKLHVGLGVSDPSTRAGAGEIIALDPEGCTLVLKRGQTLAGVPLPRALIPGGPLPIPHQQDALARLGRSLLEGDHRFPALESILRRTPFERPVQTTDLEQMKELVRSLDRRHLVIQGPPGSGKTWTSGRLIADLIARGKRVGVAAQSHKAIHNLLDAVVEAAAEAGISYTAQKKASAGNPESFYGGEQIENVTASGECGDCDLMAGTAWLFSDVAHEGTLDYLFVDEAGQVSLADALAMGTAAKNVVLVGDPQQLPQVVQGTHPPGAGASVLAHLLGDQATIPPDRGLFLERTFRLHPEICHYVSEEFYEGRLHPDPVTQARTTPLGTGLRFLPVPHRGRRQSSPEEAEAVAAEIERLLRAGLPAGEVMVVSPYNAQVQLLREMVPEGVRVGTVDKFQGQEATVVLYSLASSSDGDIPRGLEFLLSRNRFNVAVSRARCLAYLVASPALLDVDCRTIAQMRLANALCRFVELATPVPCAAPLAAVGS